MTQRLPFGPKYLLFWKVMTGGYAGGTAGDSLAGDAVTGAYVDTYPKDIGYTFADAQKAQQTGGGVRVANVITSDRPADPFTINSAVLDSTLIAMLTAGAVDTTNSQFTYSMLNSSKVDLPNIGVAVLQQFYSPSRTSNTKYWLTAVFPNCQVEPKLGAINENAFAPMGYLVTPNYTNVDHRGYLLDEAARMLPDEDIADHYFIETANPLHIATTKAASTAAINITLPYLPVESTVTLNASKNDAYRNGTAEALTSTSTTTGATVVPAGAADDIIVITYQTNYVSSS